MIYKIIFFIILALIYVTTSNEEMIILSHSTEFHNYNWPNFCNIVQLDFIAKEFQKNDNYDLIKCLNEMDVQEPTIEELNNYVPVTLDYDNLEELLEDKQDYNLLNDQIIKINDGTKFGSLKKSINNSGKMINVLDNNNEFPESMESRNHFVLESNNIEEDKLMWDKLRLYIERFMLNNIPEAYCDRYFKRIDIIDEACDIFDKYKFNSEKYLSIFEHSQDLIIIEKFKQIISNMGKSPEFNQETYDEFKIEFDNKILKNLDFEVLRSKLFSKQENNDEKSFVFFSEFMKVYKYVYNIPELLTFCGLFSTASYDRVVFIIHIINVFFKNYLGNKVFVLCMIARAIQCFFNNQFDIFKISYFEIVFCKKHRQNLYYFTWEFNSQKRKDLDFRKSIDSRCISNDKKHLNVILLLYLYQTKILDKYRKIDPKDIKLIKDVIHKVKNMEDCIICLYNEYLNILLEIRIKIF